MKILLQLLFFCSFAICWNESLMKNLISSLNKAANFYEVHFNQVNLDSIFGLRAAEGVLYELLHSESVNLHLYPASKDQLSKLYISIQTTAEKAYKRFQESTDQYDDSFKPVIVKKWYYHHEKRKRAKIFNERFSRQKGGEENDEEEMNEDSSDFCMTNLLGTQREGDRKACVIPKECWKMMTRAGARGYFLTHQGLYFLLADKLGCTQKIGESYNYNKEEQFYDIGSNIYKEMLELKKKGLMETEERDLFLEQGLLCTWLGIASCFSEDSLHLVLTWQDHRSGCVKEVEMMQESAMHGMRQLKVEQTITGGCLSHATGLFIAYIATSIHWLVIERKNQSLFSSITEQWLSRDIYYTSGFLSLCFILCIILVYVYRRRYYRGRLSRTFFC